MGKLITVDGRAVDPAIRDEALATFIFEQMINCGKMLHQVCLEIDAVYSTVLAWLNKEHADDLDDAKREAIEYWMAKAMQTADVELDGSHADHARVQKVQIDTFKWFAPRLKPRTYGDFQKVELSGEGGEPLQVEIVNYSKPDRTHDDAWHERNDSD